jgi:hypothetical protein
MTIHFYYVALDIIYGLNLSVVLDIVYKCNLSLELDVIYEFDLKVLLGCDFELLGCDFELLHIATKSCYFFLIIYFGT